MIETIGKFLNEYHQQIFLFAMFFFFLQLILGFFLGWNIKSKGLRIIGKLKSKEDKKAIIEYAYNGMSLQKEIDALSQRDMQGEIFFAQNPRRINHIPLKSSTYIKDTALDKMTVGDEICIFAYKGNIFVDNSFLEQKGYLEKSPYDERNNWNKVNIWNILIGVIIIIIVLIFLSIAMIWI